MTRTGKLLFTPFAFLIGLIGGAIYFSYYMVYYTWNNKDENEIKEIIDRLMNDLKNGS
jgi:hypothetical protein